MNIFTTFYIVLFILHSSIMLVDEFYFHIKRGLPRWERIGHPVDTLCTLVCFSIVVFLPINIFTMIIYGIFFILSCLIITKDEAQHLKNCNKYEQYIHALLFVFHPIILINIFLSWSSFSPSPIPILNSLSSHTLKIIILFQFFSIILFLMYQIIFWNFLKPFFDKRRDVNNSIYKEFGDDLWYHSKGVLGLLRSESRTRNTWIIQKLEEYSEGKPLKVLDLGCGGGFLSNALALQNFAVTGVDLYAEPLAVAKKHDTTQSVNYIQANALSLPFEDETFDAICALDFLEHVEDVNSIITECARVLKKGGQIYFHTFNRNPISWFIAIKCVEWFIKDTPQNLHVYRLFIKPQELIESFERIGFSKKELLGLQPILTLKSIYHIITKGEVPDDFNFKISKSLLIGYLGLVEKD